MSREEIQEGERLQKVLANAGFGSRREMERLIEAGEVKVNGKPAKLGDRVVPEDRILVAGKKVGAWRLKPQPRRVLLYNKPEGELVTRSDPDGRDTVFGNLPKLRGQRWIAVGRLDINTSGLLLLTTDGELANRLMHPSHQVEREYAVRVHGQVDDAILQQLVNGVELEDGPARFEEIVDSGGQGSNHWYHLVIVEGRTREVRRLWEAVGVQVSRLKRVRYGPVILDSSLSIGRWREASAEEASALLASVGLEGESKAKTKAKAKAKAKVNVTAKQGRPAKKPQKSPYRRKSSKHDRG